MIASVGQVSAQAPQDTHVDSRNPLSRPAAMLAAKPRPVAVRANAPWISSQARTQRPQEMHSSCWKARYGWRLSCSTVCVAPGQRGVPTSSQRATAASSVCGSGAVGSSERTSSTIARSLDVGTPRWPGTTHPVDHDTRHPYLAFQHELCISCGRCVRACDEIQGAFALTATGRGFAANIAAGLDKGFRESTCVSCGACADTCPTDAITEITLLPL